ncbi:transposase [Kocuria sp. NPDC057446]|uniref:transposase n=1 Tax=Kocuria sp. NPDC057446 TaxID=3346137 RepID=UPI0036BFCCD3
MVSALARIRQQLGINAESLRNWVRQAEVDEGYCPGITTDDAQRLAELTKEVRGSLQGQRQLQRRSRVKWPVAGPYLR